ncbi:MAG: DUF47 family protein [Azonexus sp.]|jgi:hypothetical protein|nr:DUF47 family protein [Azonexus sp.]
MLNNVMPQRGTFFELLGSHTDRLVAGANATMRLVSGLGNKGVDAAALIEEVNANESSADRIKDDFIRLLYESFTTPINREQLHTLIVDLDRILDTLQSVANAIAMYNIEGSTSEARTMASLAADACLRLNRAVITLADRSREQESLIEFCREVDLIEGVASQAMREAVTKLFEHEGDEAAAWHAMKMRGFYFTQEEVLRGCKRAAKTIEEILIENS